MKKIILLIFPFLLFGFTSFAQNPTPVSIEEVIIPQYVKGAKAFAGTIPGDEEGEGDGEEEEATAYTFQTVPFVMRATLKMGVVNAGKTYRYIVKVSAVEKIPPIRDEDGNEGDTTIISIESGNYIGIKLNGDFQRGTSTLFTREYGEFTTDAAGDYTGWFIAEPIKDAPEDEVEEREFFITIKTNRGGTFGGVTGGYTLTTTQTITPIDFETIAGAPTGATAIRSTPATGGVAKNFVLLYDNEEGTGRPVTGTLIEDDGAPAPATIVDINNAETQVYGPFYVDSVDGKDRTWGNMIPNNLPNGIRRIEQRSLADGSLVGFNTSSDGTWAAPGDTLVDTKNAAGGTSKVIVLDGNIVNLRQDNEEQTVTFTPFISPRDFGSASFTLSATSSAGQPVTFASGNTNVATISGNRVTIVGVGDAVITATAAGNEQYGTARATQTLRVNKAEQTIVLTNIQAKIYGDAAFNLSATVNSGLDLTFSSNNPDIATISGNRVTITGAGNAIISVNQAGNTNYNAATAVSQTLTVAKAPLTITADDKPKGIGDPVPTLTATYSGFKYDDNVNSLNTPVVLSTTATAQSSPGDYDITLSGAASTNYEIIYVNGTLTVYSNSLNITFNAVPEKTYGDAPFNPGASSESGVQPTYSSSNLQVADVDVNGNVRITGAGTAIIAANFPASGTFPPGISEQQLIVAKKPLEVLVEDQNRAYGQENPGFTATYNGFVNDDDASDLLAEPVFSTTAISTSPVGTYPVTVNGALSDNYTFNYPDVKLTVNKAVINVVVGNVSRVFGEANPSFSVTYAGFVNNENEAALTAGANAATTATAASNVGNYLITASGAASTNYAFTYTDGTLTITPVTPTITFNPLPVKTLGEPDFNPGAIISGGEGAIYTSSNINVARIVNGQIQLVGAGNTTITATTPANQNYTSTQTAERELIVSKAAQVINFAEIPAQQRGSAAFTLNATSSSGLPVTLITSDSLVASLKGSALQPLRVGTTQIVATQAGNENYLPAEQVVRTLTVINEDGEKLRVHPALSVDGDGINEFLTIEGIKDYPYNHVTIINRNGIKVFDIQNYDNDQNVFVGKRNPGGENLPAGTYFCLIEYNVNSVIKRKTSYFILKY